MQLSVNNTNKVYETPSEYRMMTIHLDSNENGEPEDIDVYEHEAIYVLHKGQGLEKDAIIVHKDLNTMNNDITNLIELKKPNEFDNKTRRLFHKPFVYQNFNKNVIKEHFPDIYERLWSKKRVQKKDDTTAEVDHQTENKS